MNHRLRPTLGIMGLATLVVSCGPDQSSPDDHRSTGGSVSTGGSGAVESTGGAGSNTGGLGPGGTGGTGPGGTGGAGVGGSGGFSTGGFATGGVGSESGGVATGGVGIGGTGAGGTGGFGAGGSSGASGASDTGGAPPATRPALVTSGEGSYWQQGELTETSASNATVTVNENNELQEWTGFGGTFNEAGWDALAELSPSDLDRAIRLLFDANDGANFVWGRIPIGASDYAMSRYTLAETPNDYAMEHFSIDRDRQRLIPYIQAALEVKPNLRLWATPWSPPAWMKDSNNVDGTDAGSTFVSHMLSDPQILEAYALYFARFVEEYATVGIHIEQVQPQNEPGYQTRYPSCLWDSGLLGRFVGDYLGPTLESRGLDTEIWFGTLSNDQTYSGQIQGLTGAAARYTVGVGLQWNTRPNVQTLANRGFLIMQTEHKCGNYPWEGGFNPDRPPNDHAYALESWGLIRDWINAGVHAYSAWNMVLDTVGQNLDEARAWPQNALLTVNRATDTLTATPAYYVFRHLSYFVDPGAVRLGTTGGDALAFRNPDGSIVTVLHNAGGQPTQTTLAVGGTTVQFQVPARGWATVHWNG